MDLDDRELVSSERHGASSQLTGELHSPSTGRGTQDPGDRAAEAVGLMPAGDPPIAIERDTEIAAKAGPGERRSHARRPRAPIRHGSAHGALRGAAATG